jgi:hypothetical protein
MYGKISNMAHTPKTRATAYEKMKRRRQQWFDNNGPCSLCGSSEKLELHHRNPTEKVSHNVWSWADARRLAELAKCDVVCWSCHHKVIHVAPITHGASGYARQCRCETCIKGQVERVYKWRLSAWGTKASKPRR